MNFTEFIDQHKWNQILQKFIDVLRINLLIVDTTGRSILIPQTDFLRARHLMNLFKESGNILDRFKYQGHYLEYKDSYDLFTFALPMRAADGKAIAYIIAGPVIVNKRLDKDEYLELSRKFKQDYDEMMNIIDEVRIVSFINLKSILDLLSQVAQHLTELSIGRYELISGIQSHGNGDGDGKKSGKAKSLVEAILNLAIMISEAEAGSIMTYNPQTEDLTVVASQGLNPSAAQNRMKLGEGIAGMAAQEQETYVIHGQNASSNRIKHLLRRPEIKHSIVMPIALENRVVGVLNLHTTKENPRMSGDMEAILRHLSQLTSVAFQSL